MRHASNRPRARYITTLAAFAVAASALCGGTAVAQGTSAMGNKPDPRIGLKAGWNDAGEASRNLELIAHRARPEHFFNPTSLGDFTYVNSDLAFSGNFVFQGSFNGFQVWDVSTPSNPTLRTTFVCPGGQGDMSVYHSLLFMSVEQTSGRLDCGTQGVKDSVSAERFRGIRIFDISDIDHPKQIADVQTCRGSHTHTLVLDPKDTSNVYIYVSGTSPVRSPNELAGCDPNATDPNTSLYSIDVIRVPLAAPATAKVIGSPRVFADSAGAPAGLWKGGNHGDSTQTTAVTNQCHDITAYSAIGLAAGACAGNGILLDISNPASPRRVAETSDPNFAYWHSATFSNNGHKVIFTDEWGGGVAPRCRATDPKKWGADAIYTLTGTKLTPIGYYKLPVVQTDQENCVAHNGTLIPVPGRDILVQAWYQGGVSVFDFTDGAHPQEIAFFDRGPMDATKLILSGFWSAYWHNGHIYGSEIGRGLDIFTLKPSEFLTQNEIDAARLVHYDVLNPQNQQRVTWPASFIVARAYLDQVRRNSAVPRAWSTRVTSSLARAERLKGAARRTALTQLATQLDRDANGSAESARVRMMADDVRQLADSRS